MYGAQTETRDRSGMTPLMRAARHSQGMEQVLILLNYSADVNAMTDHRNDYRTVLHYAVLSGNLSLVNLLLKQGAKVDRMPPDGQADKPSPLHLAILRGDPALVRILIESGANVNRSSNIIGSPLHVACADNVPHRIEIMKVNRNFPNFQLRYENYFNFTHADASFIRCRSEYSCSWRRRQHISSSSISGSIGEQCDASHIGRIEINVKIRRQSQYANPIQGSRWSFELPDKYTILFTSIRNINGSRRMF